MLQQDDVLETNLLYTVILLLSSLFLLQDFPWSKASSTMTRCGSMVVKERPMAKISRHWDISDLPIVELPALKTALG